MFPITTIKRDLIYLSVTELLKFHSIAEGGDLCIDFCGFLGDICFCRFHKFVLFLFSNPEVGRFGLSFSFQSLNNGLIFPSGFVSQSANRSELSIWLNFDLLEARRNNHALALIVGSWNTLEDLKMLSIRRKKAKQMTRRV